MAFNISARKRLAAIMGSALADWRHCTLAIRCRPEACSAVRRVPVRDILAREPDIAMAEMLARLRCRSCGKRPANVWAECQLPGEPKRVTPLVGPTVQAG